MRKIILCGSKKYENQNFDSLVDSFQNIVRHNSLHNKHGYGKRYATVQVLNQHMFLNWTSTSIGADIMVSKKLDVNAIYKAYSHSGRTLDDTIYFKEYLSHVESKIHLRGNAVGLLRNMGYEFDKDPLCGTSSVAFFASKGMVPFLIGYSLELSSFEKHVTNEYDMSKRNMHHVRSNDTAAIIDMHNKGLVDASFCTIKDILGKKVMDDSIITPTKEAFDILESLKE